MQNPNLLYDKSYSNPIRKDQADKVVEYFKKNRGWVYIAKTKDNSYLKIGRTKKDPYTRAKSLSSTGVFSDYEVVFALRVFNQLYVEKFIHKLLVKHRVSKEFFAVNTDKAVEAFEQAMNYENEMLGRFFDIELVEEDVNTLPHYLK